jgi:hypothetical protein
MRLENELGLYRQFNFFSYSLPWSCRVASAGVLRYGLQLPHALAAVNVFVLMKIQPESERHNRRINIAVNQAISSCRIDRPQP